MMSGEKGKAKWLPYLIRGIMAIVVAITLVQQFAVPGTKASNFPIYLGVYFLANGMLGLKLARADPDQKRLTILSAITVIEGLALIVVYPFSSYRNSLISTDIGRYAFTLL